MSSLPVAFCGTPQQSLQPFQSPLTGDKPQHIQSMRPAGPGGAAAAGTESPVNTEPSQKCRCFGYPTHSCFIWLSIMCNRKENLSFLFLWCPSPCIPRGLSSGFAAMRGLGGSEGCPCPISEHCGNTWSLRHTFYRSAAAARTHASLLWQQVQEENGHPSWLFNEWLQMHNNEKPSK